MKRYVRIMKKKNRIAAILSSALMLSCSMTAHAWDFSNLYYFGTTGMDTFEEMQVLDDKGMFQYHADYTSKWENTGKKYYICTIDVDYKKSREYVNAHLDEIPVLRIPEYLWGAPAVMVIPYEKMLRFRLRDDIELDTAAEQAAKIAKKYFPESESCTHGRPSERHRFYALTENDDAARSEEKAEQMMRELAAAGLISEFNSWG